MEKVTAKTHRYMLANLHSKFIRIKYPIPDILM